MGSKDKKPKKHKREEIAPAESEAILFLFSDSKALKEAGLDEELVAHIAKRVEEGDNNYSVHLTGSSMFFEYSGRNTGYAEAERLRKAAAAVQQQIQQRKLRSLRLCDLQKDEACSSAVYEGLRLSAYRFQRHKTQKTETVYPEEILVDSSLLDGKTLQAVDMTIEAALIARDLVNEPASHLDAAALGEAFVKLGNEYGFEVDIWNKSKITSQKFYGLLAVNKGSQKPPVFAIMEYKPAGAINKKPIVLVGKGVVFDTGGLSLKPTPSSMDYMKCDMAGAAVVGGVMSGVAGLGLPLYVVGLVPITDNRPGEDAICPGDIISTHKGLSVEVLNTDAEGRLILADALSYASRYNPELVLDFATLTGAAARALGSYGSALMGNASDEVKNSLRDCGEATYERLAELPLWEEYADEMKGDISDLKNLGKGEGGAQSAAMFLRNFTDYPWLHLDIAGTAFTHAATGYIAKGGTGVGVRLMLEFLKRRAQHGK
jgi:leucyl aminopeptidase